MKYNSSSIKSVLAATLVTVLFSPIALSQSLGSSQQSEHACTVVSNIHGQTPRLENKQIYSFNWLAIKQGKVLATGNNPVSAEYSTCKQIDGKNQYLLPGIIDAHGHVSGLGFEILSVQLRGVSSESAAVEQVVNFAKQNPQTQWILGRGWNQVLWPEQNFPTKASLDKTGINKPVLLSRIDGHAAWANSKALEIAGINKSTPDPEGGKIVRDDSGNATGVLIDNAIGLVEQKIPAPSALELSFAFDKAFQHLLSLGITSVHDAGVSEADRQYYLDQSNNHRLPVRIYGMLSGSDPNLTKWLAQGPIMTADDRLVLRSVKLYSDGALGSRGAALLAPYSDDKDNRGLLVTQPEVLDQLIETTLKHQFQTNVHAIGDRGNRNVVNAFEKAYAKVGGQALRNRIEHAQVVSLEDIPRFKTLQLIASMQPVHATSDMNMAEDRIGAERLKGAYAWQRFIGQGTVIASGSDFPVELANPFHGFHAAITRQDHQSQPTQGWVVEQAMTPQQTLTSFTLDAAYAAHQEKVIGSLEPGKWADFILVDQDVIKGNPQLLWQTQVLETWVAGEKVFSRTSQVKSSH